VRKYQIGVRMRDRVHMRERGRCATGEDARPFIAKLYVRALSARTFRQQPAHDFQFLMHETHTYLRRMRHLIGKKSRVVVFDEA